MIQNLRNKLERQKGERDSIEKSLEQTKRKLRDLKMDARNLEKAGEVIKQVANKTQSQLTYHISDIVSMAMEAVFPDDPYELKVEFVQRRNATECDLLFKRGDNEIDPLESSGYGAIDITSFALRIASWSMQQPRSRNTIILDEPFRFLSADKQIKASQMVKEISDKLGIQFIIITHNSDLSEYADKLFNIQQKERVSHVTTAEN